MCILSPSNSFVKLFTHSAFSLYFLGCYILRCVDISLIFLLSSVLSGLFPQVVLLFFLVLPFPFSLHAPASFLCFIILACFRRFFFICVSSRISHSGFDFSSCFLRGSQFFHKLISPLHRLVNLIRSYYSLIYTCKLVFDLFFPFPF